MITVKQLIQAAPFPEDVRGELLSKADSFSPEKKLEVSEACWALISTEFQNKLDFAFKKASLEIAKGEKQYTQEDFKKIEGDLLKELILKLQATGAEEQIEEIREKLAGQTKTS